MGDEGEQRPAGENLENGRAPAGPGEASSLSQTSQWGGAEVEAGPRPERGKGSRVKMGNEVSCDQSQASLLGSRGPAKGGVLLSPKLQAEAGQNSLGRAMGRINRAREPPPSLSPSSQLGQEGGGGVSSLSTGHIGRPFQDPSALHSPPPPPLERLYSFHQPGLNPVTSTSSFLWARKAPSPASPRV